MSMIHGLPLDVARDPERGGALREATIDEIDRACKAEQLETH